VAEDTIHPWRSIRRIIARSGVSASPLLLGLALRVLERGCELLPYLLCWVWFGAVLGAPMSDWHWLTDARWLALALMALFLLQWSFALAGQKLCFLSSYRIITRYRQRLLEQMRHLPIGVLRDHRLGSMSSLLTDDVNRIEAIFSHILADFIAAAGLALTAMTLLALLEWHLALALAALLPLAVLILIVSRRLFQRASLRKHARLKAASALLVEYVAGLTTLRLFNRAPVFIQRLNTTFAELTALSLGLEKWGGAPVMLFRLVVECGLVVALLVGGCALIAQDFSALVWLAFFLLAYKFLSPLLELAEYLVMLRHACHSETKLDALWRIPLLPEPAEPRRPAHFAVQFDKVSFAYDNTEVLRDVSFEVPQGSVTAIVGPSGAGKSTLLHLLARFYSPDAGAIRIGGVDVREIGSDQLYGLVSMVFQQVQLFDDSVLENIRAGRIDASDEEVQRACQSADCDAFVRRFAQGYQTRIGESGLSLSGGERQRLSIARALLKNAPLLLLDEVTSSVDAHSQHAIQTALARLAVGRTVVMVAHRLNTIRHAQQILVLDQGVVVERGGHETLLQHGGLYAAMWQAQTAGR